MTLVEFFEKYKSKNTGFRGALEQSVLNHKLKNDLTKLQTTVTGIKLMLYMISNIKYQPINYHTCLTFCESIGLVTVQDFIDWSNSLKIAKVFDIINYSDMIPFKFTDIAIWQHTRLLDLKKLVSNTIPDTYKEKNINYYFNDNTYYIPTYKAIKDYIENNTTNKLRYIVEKRDCDDFAYLFKCGFKNSGIGNTTVAICEVNLYTKDWESIYAAHAINLIVYSDKDKNYVKLFEPQTDELIDFGSTLAGTKYYKIRKLEFI